MCDKKQKSNQQTNTTPPGDHPPSRDKNDLPYTPDVDSDDIILR